MGCSLIQSTQNRDMTYHAPPPILGVFYPNTFRVNTSQINNIAFASLVGCFPKSPEQITQERIMLKITLS